MGDGDPLVRTPASIIAQGGDSAPLRICQACVAELLVDGAAITMMTDADRQELVCAEVASELEELQFSLGEGPSFAAFTSGSPVLISDPDGTINHRWPMFATHARAMKVRGLYGFPCNWARSKSGSWTSIASGPVRCSPSSWPAHCAPQTRRCGRCSTTVPARHWMATATALVARLPAPQG
jgi:hypothetical protein